MTARASGNGHRATATAHRALRQPRPRPTSGRGCGSAAGWPAAGSTASTWPSWTCATTPGIVQCVVDGSADVRSEYVVAVDGHGAAPARGHGERRLATGDVEVGDCTVEVLVGGRAAAVPVEDRAEVDEAVRLRHRYVDLRRPRMQAQPADAGRGQRGPPARHGRQGFCEVETPLLWAPDPRGGPGVRRAQPPAPGVVLRPAPEPPAGQAAAHGGRVRPLLPDRPVPARRGPPGRPPVRVHPARHGGLLRRPGRRARPSSPRPCSTPPRRPPASGPAPSSR